jgi:predicted MFS family arabinose efflux permease
MLSGPARTIAVVCAAQTLAQLGAFTFPALLPSFIDEWQLSHSEAGWLAGIFFGAYCVSVPFLVTLTDRISARRIYMLAVALTSCSHLGMAWLADDFWTGMLFRALAGIGWAGTYMVGLRALSDELEGATRSRGVALHAASIGVSGALSFLIAGLVSGWFDWHWAFCLVALGSLCAMVITWLAFPRREPTVSESAAGALLDFRPVFRNRSAMAYSTGYLVHTWEMFVLRSWAVTFLVFAAGSADLVTLIVVPTIAAMLMELTGTVTSVAGNEVALRIGRQRWIMTVMFCSMILATLVGFSSGQGYGVALVMVLIYNGLIYADSSSLTAGAIGSADPERRGATLAVHGMMGYGGGFIGPVVMGVLIDALGGESVEAWGLGFAHVALVVAVGLLGLWWLKPKDLDGDRSTKA